MSERRTYLPQAKIPSAWYNVLADLPNPPSPYLHPGTKEPVVPTDLAATFPEALIVQEVSTERWIDIPGEVIDMYRQCLPTQKKRPRLQNGGAVRFLRITYESLSAKYSHLHILDLANADPNSSIPKLPETINA